MLVPARRNATPSSHRWLLPYADFLTLLFAVFVVLFAAERSGKNSVQELSRAVLAAVHRSQPAPVPVPVEKMSMRDPRASSSACARRPSSPPARRKSIPPPTPCWTGWPRS